MAISMIILCDDNVQATCVRVVARGGAAVCLSAGGISYLDNRATLTPYTSRSPLYEVSRASQ